MNGARIGTAAIMSQQAEQGQERDKLGLGQRLQPIRRPSAISYLSNDDSVHTAPEEIDDKQPNGDEEDDDGPAPRETGLNGHLRFNGDIEKASASSSRQTSLTVPHLVRGNSSTARSSLGNASLATSNSSYLPRGNNPAPSAATRTLASSQGHSSRSGDEVDITAALIRRLYERLDVDGVDGDGWKEGRELTRDGIINSEGCERLEQDACLAAQLKRSVHQADMSDKAQDVLKQVDRYGFFASSHPQAQASQCARLATIRAAPMMVLTDSPLSKLRRKGRKSQPAPERLQAAELVSNGRRSASVNVPSLTTEDSAARAIELGRISKWDKMLRPANDQRNKGGSGSNWAWAPGWSARQRDDSNGKYRKLQRRVFKGIPDRWRMAAWSVMIDDMLALRSPKNVQSDAALAREFSDLMSQESAQDIQIDLDVPRTISGHVLFHTRYGHGQRALFHVLHAIGLRTDVDGQGGYCQGMGPIAATLLCYFEPERAFVSMCRLFDTYGAASILAPGFPGLRQLFHAQSALVQHLMPDVTQAFEDHDIFVDAYATKWYITLFANSFPFDTQLRIWDAMLLEGIDVLIVVAVGIIWAFRDGIVRKDATFESILSTLSSFFYVEDNDAFMRWVRKTWRRKDVRRTIDDAKREWRLSQ